MGRNTLRAFASILGTRIGKLALAVLITPIIVRLLGNSNYGDYALILSIFGLLSTVVHSGIFNGLRKYIAENRELEGWEDYIFTFYVRVAVFTSITVGLLIYLASTTQFVTEWFGPEFEQYFVLLAVLVIANQLYSVARGSLMGFGLEHYSEPLQILDKFLFGSVAIGLIYLGWGVKGALIGKIIAITVVGFIAFYATRSNISFRTVFQRLPENIPRRELLTFNLNSILLALLTVSLYHVDIILLQPIAGSEQTGYYKAALVIAEFLWFVPMAIQYTLVQSVSEMWSDGEYDRVSEIASDVTRYSLAFILLLIIGLAALADEFVPLYFGSEFSVAVDPLLLLLPGVLGFAIARPIFAIGQGIGDLRQIIYATASASIVNLVLNLILIPRYGMYGAAVATSIGYGSMLFFHVWCARRIGFDPLKELRFFRILATVLLTAPVIFGLAQIITNIVLSLTIVPTVGLLLYTAISIKLGVIQPDEIEAVATRMPSPVDKIVYTIHDLSV
ncbi:polysaccharide biosynthesis C-terminal domain-containing protein [Haloarcula laminariae]|uniref:oligosaccharide flippase family protein n=1 Tax=Haloarcula laminariae TaxID=2961577 RepID=UPI0021CA57D9|nr:polysaccharide biosynthesis C-terminal domain-containing protein [Halomicroarcula laminariae]